MACLPPEAMPFLKATMDPSLSSEQHVLALLDLLPALGEEKCRFESEQDVDAFVDLLFAGLEEMGDFYDRSEVRQGLLDCRYWHDQFSPLTLLELNPSSVQVGESVQRMILLARYNPSFPTFLWNAEFLNFIKVFEIEVVLVAETIFRSERFVVEDPEVLLAFVDETLDIEAMTPPMVKELKAKKEAFVSAIRWLHKTSFDFFRVHADKPTKELLEAWHSTLYQTNARDRWASLPAWLNGVRRYLAAIEAPPYPSLYERIL